MKFSRIKEINILYLTFFLGLISIIFFGDKRLDNEWMNLVRNLENNNILSSRNINDEWVPNLFMPPLYPFFLYSIKKIFFFIESYYVNLILFTQLLLFIFSVKIFKKILDEIFNDNKIAILGTLIFSLYPINLYSIGQISSVVLQVFLFMFFIYNFIKYFKYSSNLNLVLYSIFSGLLILLRGEFFIFFIFSLFFLIFKKKKIYFFIYSVLIALIVISPYIIRNYLLFDAFALTKSTGFNLLKGNNPQSKVEGIGMWYGYDVVTELEESLKKIKPIKKYDLLSDKIFFDQAVKYISENPLKYFKLYIKKFFSFLFIDFESSYPNYYSKIHIIPKILISIFTILSIFYFINFKINIFNYFTLLYFFHAFIFSFFFILPRYSLSVLPIQIILSLFLYKKYLSYKITKKKK